VVRRLREAGAVLVAKLAMVELAGGMGYNHANASFTGPGLTPWNTRFWSGGSSSGPGAAVAAGLVPFAIGSETSGSILTPAAFCGVTGLRPTYGLVSRHGAMALCWTLDKLGPLGRTADDCALVLAALAGPDPLDESVVARGFAHARPAPLGGLRKLRLAVPKGVTEKVQPAVRENFEAVLRALGGDVEVTREVEWPDFPWGPAVGTIVGAEGAAAFLDLLESGRAQQLTCPADRSGGYSSLLLPAVDYLQAMRLRRPMKRAVALLFGRFDAVVAPTRASVAYPADRNFEDAYPGVSGGPALIAAGNLCGLPALALPDGFGENGLPTSFQLVGPAFSEALLVRIGHAYQQRTDWHTRRPPAA
jgi:aspartyl-tRNA(Asn)/glutamyl-tRNA(Gln) amidotransferase subunit A